MSLGSLHILGSRQFGGADRFYVRLLNALNAARDTVVDAYLRLCATLCEGR